MGNAQTQARFKKLLKTFYLHNIDDDDDDDDDDDSMHCGLPNQGANYKKNLKIILRCDRPNNLR